jgi:hypothetical protein
MVDRDLECRYAGDTSSYMVDDSTVSLVLQHCEKTADFLPFVHCFPLFLRFKHKSY